MARKLYEQEKEEQEKMKRIAQRDVEIARKTHEEEMMRIKEDEEKKNWEKTLNMIKTEIKSEKDNEMARLLMEKEELERKLAEMHQGNNNNEVVVNINGMEYPDYWTHQNRDYQIFEVANYSDEWYRVTNNFGRTMAGKNITRIQRVQNRSLWSFFYLKRQFMESKNGANENFLFHGSKTNAYDLITRDGFDHRVADLNGALGAGSYFAVSASYSHSYIPAVNNNNNVGGRRNKRRNNNNYRAEYKMLYCRVLLGVSGPGQGGLRRPPNKPGTNEIYDSCSGSNIYAVFDNHQAYPEYIIYYS